MHLTGGQYKGNKIEVPSNVKPTLSKVRESVFNVLHSFLLNEENLSFLDMFAGSGLMSLEAISRGYKATTIEKDRKTFNIIKNNFKKTGVEGNLICADSVRFLQKEDKKYDVVYIDPPWTNPDFKYSYSDILKLGLSVLNEKGILVFESEKIKKLLHQELNPIYDEKLIREKVYGRCLLSFYKA